MYIRLNELKDIIAQIEHLTKDQVKEIDLSHYDGLTKSYFNFEFTDDKGRVHSIDLDEANVE